MDDAPVVRALAGEYDVASTTLTIPHPYPDGAAEAWIETHAAGYAAGEETTFAIAEVAGEQVVGAIGLILEPDHARGELGYWVGVPYWNRGYATEAAVLAVGFGFAELGLNRIYAQHFSRNPSSGRVLQKLGMRHEGCLRQHVRRWKGFEDLEQYGVVADEWLPPAIGTP